MKSAVSILLGYLSMITFVVGTLNLGWTTLGQSLTLKEDSYQVTILWILLSLGLSLVGGVLGGYVCTTLAGEGQPVRILAIVVLGVGILFAVIEARSLSEGEVVSASEVAAAELLSFSQARSVIVQPQWFSFILAPVGAVGVYIGGMLRLRKMFG